MINGYTALKRGHGKYGANDLRGSHVRWEDSSGVHLAEITGLERKETAGSGCLFFTLRHFDGSSAGSLPVGMVYVLEREYVS